MDLITHVLLSYLFAYWIFGLQVQYLMAAAIAGALPDADILLWPLSRKFKILRHHGITHSLIGVVIIALVFSFVFSWIFTGEFYIYLLIFLIGGLGHIALDSFTQFKVSPLLLIRKKQLRFDADRAVNLFILAVSIASMSLLLAERNSVPIYTFTLTVYAVSLFYLMYAMLRIIGKYKAKIFVVSNGNHGDVLSTANPLKWLVFERINGKDSTVINLSRYNVFGNRAKKLISIRIYNRKVKRIITLSQAITASYNAVKRDWLMSTTRCVFDAGGLKDSWSVIWYSLDMAGLNYSAAIHTIIDKKGSVSIKHGWYKNNILGALL